MHKTWYLKVLDQLASTALLPFLLRDVLFDLRRHSEIGIPFKGMTGHIAFRWSPSWAYPGICAQMHIIIATMSYCIRGRRRFPYEMNITISFPTLMASGICNIKNCISYSEERIYSPLEHFCRGRALPGTNPAGRTRANPASWNIWIATDLN